MKFQEYLSEKLQPSQFRDYVKAWKKSGISKVFDHIFGNKDRVYEPYKGGPVNADGQSDTQKDIRAFLEDYPGSSYRLLDYYKGLAVHKDTRKEIKLMKAFNNLQKQIEKELKGDIPQVQAQFRHQNWEKIERLKKAFVNDKSRELAAADKLLICYSRHAYDIAGMSTDRGWESCMTLPGGDNEGGVNWHKIGAEVKQGTLIAYLIREDDKNIQNPIGRMLIKPYINMNDPKQIYFVACTGGYGTTPGKFKTQVTEWTKKLNTNVPSGFYKVHPNVEHSHLPNDVIGKDIETIKTWDGVLKHKDDFAKGKPDGGDIIGGGQIFDIDMIADNFYDDMDKNFGSILKIFEGSFSKGLAVFYKFLRACEYEEGNDYLTNWLKVFDVFITLTKINMPDPKWITPTEFRTWWQNPNNRDYRRHFNYLTIPSERFISNIVSFYKQGYWKKIKAIWG